MAKLLKLRRGTTTQHASFTGAEGEVTIDTTKDTAVVHDGSQAGGRPMAREDMSNVSSASIAGQLGTDSIAVTKIAAGTLPSDVKIVDANVSGNLTIESADIVDGTIVAGDIGADQINNTHIADSAVQRPMIADNAVNGAKIADSSITSAKILDGTIVNADVNASAAIAGTKISPDFGSQNIVTTGSISTGSFSTGGTDNLSNSNIRIENLFPTLYLNDTDNNNDFYIRNANGTFNVHDVQANVNRFEISSSGTAGFSGNLDVGAGLDVTGNMTVTGTVDGRDVAADGTKLDGIESGATADQTKSDIDGLNINADQVDGMHANEFLAVAGDEATGDITFSGGAGAVTIAANSDIRLGSGAWTGEHAGKIQHHSNHMYFQNGGGNWIFRNTSGTELLYINSSGDLVANGNVTAYSDARLKTDISTINDALGICGKLRGVSYKWLKNNEPGIGVIAQEVEKVIPEVVLTNVTTDPATGEEKEVKSVDYGKIVGVLINAINELKAEVDELKGGK